MYGFRALEEDELMRERVLQRLEAENIRFKSGPQDVLEYAVYLGMQLEASALYHSAPQLATSTSSH
ncbi:MAG: hypothetical protein SGPRY_004883 [Prymnesium sp.]